MSEDEYKVDNSAKSKRGPGNAAKLAFGTAALGLIGLFAYPIFVPETKAPFETSQSQEFQESDSSSAFARIQAEDDPISEGVDFSRLDDALAAQQSEAQRRNQALLDQISTLEQQLNDVRENARADDGQVSEQISRAIAEANQANAELLTGIQEDFRTQVAALQTENQALQQRLDLQNRTSTEADMARVEAQRQAEAERRRHAELQAAREEQQRRLKLRTESPSVVFDEGGRSTSASNDAGGSAPGSNPSTADRNLAFMQAGAEAVTVTSSEYIASPSKTVVQGTMIGATLENAVNSSLPGNVIAVVNEPVWSFDGAEVLIPSGSRVFGSYSSDIELGQARILVRWSRILTPEGQSVQIAAFGGDDQGRSGVTGRVNNRFGTRFGGAALISLIGAVPSIAASEFADNSAIAADMAEDIADNFGDATDSILNEYASLPPIISVEPGSQVSIMVDRDLEFH